MSSVYFNKAKKLDEDEGDWEKALQVCEEGIKKGFLDCAYEKGLILLLNQDPSDIDWQEVKEAFEIGTRGVEKEEDHYELAKYFTGEEYPELQDYDLSLDEFCCCRIKKGDIPIVRKMLVRQRAEAQKKGSTYSLSLLGKCDRLADRNCSLEEFVLGLRKDCVNDAFLSWTKEIDACNSLNELQETVNKIKPFEASFDKIDRLLLKSRDSGYPFLYSKETTLEEIKWFLALCEKTEGGIPWLMEKICSGLGPKEIGVLERLKDLIKRYRAWTLDITNAVIDEINHLSQRGKIETADKVIAIFEIPTQFCHGYMREIVKRREFDEARVLADADLSFPNGAENIRKALAKASKIRSNYNDEKPFHYLLCQIMLAQNFVDLEVAFGKAAAQGVSLSSTEENEWREIPKNKLSTRQKGNYLLVFCSEKLLTNPRWYHSSFEDIPGYHRLFLNSRSPFYQEVNALVQFEWDGTDPDFAYYSFYPKKQLVRYFGRSNLKDFVKNYGVTYNAAFAFCMHEETAIFCAEAGLKPVVINEVIGYPNVSSLEKEAAETKTPSCGDFRNNYLYYWDMVKDIQYCDGFSSSHFEALVVYFRAFIPGSGVKKTPVSWNGRIPKEQFEHGEFYDDNKSATLSNNIVKFAEWFDDLPIREEDIVMRVPGSDETCCDERRPTNRIVAKIIERHGKGENGNGYLIRSKEKPRHNDKEGVGRKIGTQLGTLKVVDNEGALRGKTVYLFDDICTSGTSMVACSHLLYEAGAAHVICFSIVKTWNPQYPLKSIK